MGGGGGGGGGMHPGPPSRRAMRALTWTGTPLSKILDPPTANPCLGKGRIAELQSAHGQLGLTGICQ